MIKVSDFNGIVCSPAVTLRDVLEKINQSPYLFQLVVDKEGVLLGTITDGDIRRAILRGVHIDSVAAEAMRVDPVVGTIGDAANNSKILASIRSNRAFLPIVDDLGRIVEVYVATEPFSGIGHALIMAGGFGRRLGERTQFTPKPLLPVGDSPILDHIMCALEDAGVPRLTVSVHYLADKIHNFVDARENRATVDFVEEATPLGTAGAIKLVVRWDRSPLLVINGDVVTNCDFMALHDFHVKHGLDGTIGVARYDCQVPYGVVRHNDEGIFIGIAEKPVVSNFVAAGVYYLAPEFQNLIRPDESIDMPTLLDRGREIGLKIGLFPIHEYWADVGRPDDLAAADARLRSETQ